MEKVSSPKWDRLGSQWLTLEVACCIFGYHTCFKIWEAVWGETLTCDRKPTNEKDRYAVAVKKAGVIVGLQFQY